MPYYLQCSTAGSVHWAGFLQWLWTHRCLKMNARLKTRCSLTASAEVASLISVCHCSSSGALQAKLLVQTQIPHLTPAAMSYSPQVPPQPLQCESKFRRSWFIQRRLTANCDEAAKMLYWLIWDNRHVSVLLKGKLFFGFEPKIFCLAVKGNSTPKENSFNPNLLPPPESMKY